MLFFEMFTKNFESRLRYFEQSYSKEERRGHFYRVFLFPLAFFCFLLLALIIAFKKSSRGKNKIVKVLENPTLEVQEEIQEEIPVVQIKHVSVKRPADYTSKYLYQTDFGDLDPEEKEAFLKDQLEISRKEYYNDLIIRELTAGGEGIGCNVFAEVTNIPPGQGSGGSSKPKERREEPLDIEALREKLLAPKANGGGADRSIKFEPIGTEGGN
jgi:hypothetical protein